MANLHHFLAILVLTTVLGQSVCNAQSRKRLRELEKMEEQHEVDEDEARNEAKSRHMSIQSKQTRKEMKRYKR